MSEAPPTSGTPVQAGTPTSRNTPGLKSQSQTPQPIEQTTGGNPEGSHNATPTGNSVRNFRPSYYETD